MDAHAACADAAARQGAEGAGDDRTQRARAGRADRRHPRRLAHHRRQAAHRDPARGLCSRSSTSPSTPCGTRPRQGHHARSPHRRAARTVHGRRRALAAGDLEPAVERDQVHARGRPRRAGRRVRRTSTSSSRCSDTGCGIAPEFKPYVFDRFRQLDSSSRRTHGGLGIGLAIVRHIVELHGGSVTCDSAGDRPRRDLHAAAADPAPGGGADRGGARDPAGGRDAAVQRRDGRPHRDQGAAGRRRARRARAADRGAATVRRGGRRRPTAPTRRCA